MCSQSGFFKSYFGRTLLGQLAWSVKYLNTCLPKTDKRGLIRTRSWYRVFQNLKQEKYFCTLSPLKLTVKYCPSNPFFIPLSNFILFPTPTFYTYIEKGLSTYRGYMSFVYLKSMLKRIWLDLFYLDLSIFFNLSKKDIWNSIWVLNYLKYTHFKTSVDDKFLLSVL